METRIENAIVKSVSISTERCLSAWIFVEGDGWGCGFGGYSLDEWDEARKRRVGTAYGTEFLIRCMEVLESETWEGLVGRPVRVETEGLGGGIRRIGHFTKDKWFDPKSLAVEMGLRHAD